MDCSSRSNGVRGWGHARNPEWDRVLHNLSPLPVRNGVYLAHENCPQTFSERNYDHPSMLGALGFLPGAGVDMETMRRTLRSQLAATNLPCYLPGNGGLFYAIAMMAGGWKGFPTDGSWTVNSEKN